MTTQTHHSAPDSHPTDNQSAFLPLTQPPHDPYSQVIHQNPPQLPLEQPPPNTLKRQIVDSLVSPSDVLRYRRPEKRQRTELAHQSEDMDKRHPSSFQQLEKVRPLCPSPVIGLLTLTLSWVKAPMRLYVLPKFFVHMPTCPHA